MRVTLKSRMKSSLGPLPVAGSTGMSLAPLMHSCRALAIALLIAMIPAMAGATTQAGHAPSSHGTVMAAKTTSADHQLFVDRTATGTGDGLSWPNAFTSLQDALALARTWAPANSVEIWVAQGVYFPDVGAGLANNNRSLSFQPAANVALYGGFAGAESLREQRDWHAHVTVLSGDIDGNDTVDANGVALGVSDINGNNSYHVVLLDQIQGSATLDGFTITSGLATGLGQVNGILMRVGAGLNSFNSSATLANLRIQGNLALMSGSSGQGGGIYTESDAGRSDRLTLSNVQVTHNAGRYGGGLSSRRTALDVTATTFLDNEAEAGGAVHLNLTVDVDFRDAVFRGNHATINGGAFYGFREYLALVNCELTGNSADNNGGAYYADGTTLDLKIVMTNVVISGNRAGVSGGGIYREQPSYGSSRLWNTIIWNNEDSSGVGTADSSHAGPGAARLVAVNSLVQGMIAPGTANLDGTLAANNPLFLLPLDPSAAPSQGGDFHLQLNSPVIDKGDNQARINHYNPATPIPLEGNVLTDLDGTDRILDGDGDTVATVDMGPYETTSFSIGGTVSGLLGEGLILQNSGGDDLPIASSGPFTFDTVVANFSSYAVTVASQPGTPRQTCSVTAGSGNVSGANVTNVQINCTTDTFTIGGTVSGLEGDGLVLQNNGGDDLSVAAVGPFIFATAVADLGNYAVTVATQPGAPSQTCTVIDGSGIVDAANVTNVTVSCITDTYLVTPSAGSGGSMSPATPQSVASQQTIDFTITPDPGYDIADIGGSCGGTLSGNVFTTSPIEAACTVQASFIPQTSTLIAASTNPARAMQPVEFTVDVQGVGSAPADGQIEVVAGSGESCIDNSAPEITGPVARFSCSISFTTLGSRQLVATYSASTTHSGSASAPLIMAVKRFADVSIGIDDGVLQAAPGAPASYLVELRNAGPDDAPNTQLIVAADPALINASWICSAVGAAVCPAPSGTGEVAFSVNLPPASGLDIIQDGTLPASLPISVVVQAQANVSDADPDEVFDPLAGNNLATDVNDADGLFRDGFDP
jgi:hypothetical protein